MTPEKAYMELADAIKKHGEPVCQTTDPEQWFPEVGVNTTNRELANVIKLCKECPVMSECLTFALVNFEPFGIWGGTTVKERQRMRVAGGKGRGRPKTKTPA